MRVVCVCAVGENAVDLQHRVQLVHGSFHAQIWQPKLLKFVDTSTIKNLPPAPKKASEARLNKLLGDDDDDTN